MADLSFQIPDEALPQVPVRKFKIRNAEGKVVDVVIRLAFGSDLMDSMNTTNKKVSATEQFYSMVARVTSFNGLPTQLNEFRRLPLAALTKISKEFNALNGADPLEGDSKDETGEES